MNATQIKDAVQDTEMENENRMEYNENEARLNALHQLLSNTDYIAAKIAEGAATKEEYSDILRKRQAWRDEINKLLFNEL